jgi:regulator of sigma E protease
MTFYIIGTLAFIFVLGAAVVLHEFGHFAVAKLLGIRVEVFSFGFGPRIFGKRWGTTDYRVSAIPLGGYVKLGGDESNAAIEGAGSTDIPPKEQFNLRPKWQKIAVAVAGPVMNIMTALAIPFAGAMLLGVPTTPLPNISSVRSNGPAQAAGLQVGDKIVAFNGVENPSWDRIRGDVLLSPGNELPMTVERNGQRLALKITPTTYTEGKNKIGVVDFMPDYGNVPVLVGSVEKGSPAEKSGLRKDDRFITLGHMPVHSADQVRDYIRQHKTEPIPIEVERNGQTLAIEARIPEGGQVLGVRPVEDLPRVNVGPVQAFGYAINSNREILRLTGVALGQFFSGRRSAGETLSGPLGIADAASTAANELGWSGVFDTLSFLSLSLGVFNLLPIPVLDGGAIALLLLEALLGIVGITLTMGVRERIQQVGFVVLILLMGFVITLDVSKQVSPRRSSGDDKPAVQQK